MYLYYCSFGCWTKRRWWHLVSPIRLHWTWKCQSLQPTWNWGCSWLRCHVTPMKDRLFTLQCKLCVPIHTQTHTHNHLILPTVCVTLPLQYNAPLTNNIFHWTIFFALILDNASLSLIPAADSGDSDVASFDADGSNWAEAACSGRVLLFLCRQLSEYWPALRHS